MHQQLNVHPGHGEQPGRHVHNWCREESANHHPGCDLWTEDVNSLEQQQGRGVCEGPSSWIADTLHGDIISLNTSKNETNLDILLDVTD